jgi:hypothetical protein
MSVEPHVPCVRCIRAGRTQTNTGRSLEVLGFTRLLSLPCMECAQSMLLRQQQDFAEPVTTSQEKEELRQEDQAQRDNEINLMFEIDFDMAASASHPIRDKRPTGRERSIREKHAHQLAESTQRTQAVYDQGLQEATQQESEALEVQEALIAASKMELQAKMSK